MVNIWEQITEKLNEENECGLCFEFVGAGRADYFNNLQPRINDSGSCCVYIGLLKFGSKKKFIDKGQGLMEESSENRFELVVGIPSSLDIQFYNENPDHDVNESKYMKYIKPIIDCLGDNYSLPCDEFPGMEIQEWGWDLLLNYQDLNLDGIKINGVFKKYAE